MLDKTNKIKLGSLVPLRLNLERSTATKIEIIISQKLLSLLSPTMHDFHQQPVSHLKPDAQ